MSMLFKVSNSYVDNGQNTIQGCEIGGLKVGWTLGIRSTLI
jgi:hypothetical protein